MCPPSASPPLTTPLTLAARAEEPWQTKRFAPVCLLSGPTDGAEDPLFPPGPDLPQHRHSHMPMRCSTVATRLALADPAPWDRTVVFSWCGASRGE